MYKLTSDRVKQAMTDVMLYEHLKAAGLTDRQIESFVIPFVDCGYTMGGQFFVSILTDNPTLAGDNRQKYRGGKWRENWGRVVFTITTKKDLKQYLTLCKIYNNALLYRSISDSGKERFIDASAALLLFIESRCSGRYKKLNVDL